MITGCSATLERSSRCALWEGAFNNHIAGLGCVSSKQPCSHRLRPYSKQNRCGCRWDRRGRERSGSVTTSFHSPLLCPRPCPALCASIHWTPRATSSTKSRPRCSRFVCFWSFGGLSGKRLMLIGSGVLYLLHAARFYTLSSSPCLPLTNQTPVWSPCYGLQSDGRAEGVAARASPARTTAQPGPGRADFRVLLLQEHAGVCGAADSGAIRPVLPWEEPGCDVLSTGEIYWGGGERRAEVTW